MAVLTEIFKEARRLHKLGLAIHWLKEKSKRPVDSGWTTGPRKAWSYLEETYYDGLNVGVRLGTPSKIGEHYLAVIDVDVKSTSQDHRREALHAVKQIVGAKELPFVRSGRGNGSRHYYLLTETPQTPFKAAQSPDVVKVFMPSAKPSKREIRELSAQELDEGLRLRPAWEVSIMGEGQQVVLPPSVHPDSGELYTWGRHVKTSNDLLVFDLSGVKAHQKEESGEAEKGASDNKKVTVEDFEVVEVDLDWLPISDKVREAIKTGAGVEDRSAYLLVASRALYKAQLSRNEVLSVLTDPNTFMGQCGYDHAQTQSRKRAAQWVFKYSAKMVEDETLAENIFTAAADIKPNKIGKVEQTAQAEELEKDVDWRDYLERAKSGKTLPSFNNCKLILKNVCDTPLIFGHDMFAVNDFYMVATPWGGKVDEPVKDIDVVRVKDYCATKFGVEFSDNTIYQAITAIADVNRFHPVRDYIRSLKWDGKKRIDTWLRDYAGVTKSPEPYLSEVSRKTLVALIARVMEPGCKYDHVLILEGIQGAGKSSILSALAGKWFSDANLNIGDKDAVMTMQSKWLIELGELSAMGRAEIEQVKQFVTQRTDRIRAPYGRKVEEFPRQSIFVGSTNDEEYLRDLTGNRRFWPVKAGGALYWKDLEDDRDQLFAEAYECYLAGEDLYLVGEALVQARYEQGLRAAKDEWASTVADIVMGESFPAEFEMRDVAKRMDQVGANRLSGTDIQRLTRCLKILGYESFREGVGSRRRMWRKVEDEKQKSDVVGEMGRRPKRPSDVQGGMDDFY